MEVPQLPASVLHAIIRVSKISGCKASSVALPCKNARRNSLKGFVEYGMCATNCMAFEFAFEEVEGYKDTKTEGSYSIPSSWALEPDFRMLVSMSSLWY